MVLGIAAVFAASVVPGLGITNNIDTAPGNTIEWSFESYTNGQDIVADTNSSWYGEAEALIANTNVMSSSPAGNPLATTHDVVAELTANVTNMVTGGSGKSIWIDQLTQPRRWDQDGHPTDIPTDAQMAFYVNTNGHIVIYHHDWNGGVPTGASNIWTEITSPTINTGDWVRVSINMDYAYADWVGYGALGAYYFQMAINGTLLTHASQGVEDPEGVDYTLGGSHFVMATVDLGSQMNAISLHGTGYFDDMVVTTNEPTYTIVYTLSSTVADGDNGGSVTPLGDQTVAENGSQAFTVTASNHWTIEKVVITENGVTTTNILGASPYEKNFTNVAANGSIAAYFLADTTNGVPIWWMAGHGIQGEDPDGNNDGDSLTVRQEWMASQDPTVNAEFAITRTWQADGTNYIEWTCTGVDPSLPPIDIGRATDLTAGFSNVATKARMEGTNMWGEAAVEAFYQISASTNAP